MRVIGCVGAVIKDADGRLLLIRRGHEPSKGLWSLPGGRIEDGETDAEALIREIAEETGLSVVPGGLIDTVRRPGAVPGTEYDIREYSAEIAGGTLTPGDDADDARWVSPDGLTAFPDLPLTDGLLEALRSWGVVDA
ncbi:MAG: NUDIX domain-containing protein [Nocardiopsaceae bacterium]|nr:NUDIX domain-containing protein [Nocardiopsaceae bacterium]